MLSFPELASITTTAIKDAKDNGNRLFEDDEKHTVERKWTSNSRRYFDNMIRNSSLHGVSYIADERFSIRRFVWLLVTLAAFFYSATKVYESTVRYLSYPVSTSVRRKYVDKLIFPAVSFCNLNDMRLGMMNGTMIDRAVLNNNLIANVTHEDWIYREKAAHRLDEMLVECVFDGRPCSNKNFTTFPLEDDKCFTFNSGKFDHETAYVSGAGVERSLMVTINIQHYDYYRDRTEAGIILLLHGQDETPIRVQRLHISPGFATYIEIDKKKMINLRPPYNSSCGFIKLKYFTKYSMDSCWIEQLTSYIVRKCACKAPFMPGHAPNCDGKQAETCMWPKWEKFKMEKLAKCPLPCEVDEFKWKSVSRTLFPSPAYANYLKLILGKKNLMKKQLEKTQDLTKLMRDNFVRFFIYYNDMSFEFQEQKPSYDLHAFLGDIGGQVGLFVGAGVMSYFEIIDGLIMMLYAQFY